VPSGSDQLPRSRGLRSPWSPLHSEFLFSLLHENMISLIRLCVLAAIIRLAAGVDLTDLYHAERIPAGWPKR